jgi:polyisoprenoid-binding protein YceI
MITIWNLDPAFSKVNFSIKHLMIAKVYGSFEKIAGTLKLDLEDLKNSTIDATIQTKSINTHNEERDSHIRSSDFFNCEFYHFITFKSTSASELEITGELSIHGVKKQIKLDVTRKSEELMDSLKNTNINFSATTKVKLKDFGLTWNTSLEAGGLLVGDEVNVMLDVHFSKQTP